jgi:hypothetical protein
MLSKSAEPSLLNVSLSLSPSPLHLMKIVFGGALFVTLLLCVTFGRVVRMNVRTKSSSSSLRRSFSAEFFFKNVCLRARLESAEQSGLNKACSWTTGRTHSRQNTYSLSLFLSSALPFPLLRLIWNTKKKQSL